MHGIDKYLDMDSSSEILKVLDRYYGINSTSEKYKYIMYTLNHKQAIILTYMALCKRVGITIDTIFLNRLV